MKPSTSKYATPHPLPLSTMCLALLMSACATSKQTVYDKNTTDSIRTSVKQDSVYRRDSIYIREYTRGDTVYIDRLCDRWRDRIRTEHDTIVVEREVVRETVRQPKSRKRTAVVILVVIVFVGALGGGVAYWAYRRK